MIKRFLSGEFPKSNLHTHTCYCDGKDSPEDVVKAAIASGMDTIGFSGHSYVHFDLDCCMTREQTEEYRDEIRRLKKQYGDKVNIYCGIEQDFYGDDYPMGFDYVIGSVHYLPTPDGNYFALDQSADELRASVERYYGGSYEKLWKNYFEAVSQVVSKTHCEVIGHFDLISKFNDTAALFDESNRLYLNHAISAVNELLKTDAVFEINTGAVSRGYRRLPYPSSELLRYIASHGGRFTLSSDAHSKENLLYGFRNAVNYARAAGVGSLCLWTTRGWESVSL